MADSRFTPQNKTTSQRLSTNTVGLVALSDFRKRRAEVLEQQEREAREGPPSGTGTGTGTGTSTSNTPDRSLTGTPVDAGSDSAQQDGTTGDNGGSAAESAGNGVGDAARPVKKKMKKKPQGKKLLSFDDEEEESSEAPTMFKPKTKSKLTTAIDFEDSETPDEETKSKFKANASVGLAPKSLTKAALRKEAAERETLRKEFVMIQDAVKATEIAIPFVFYDGANIPGGTVRVKKGDFVWVFLDKSRKVGAELGVGENANATRAWARVGVDDLMLVRGTVIIPHHFDFYYFVINKSLGPGGQRVFDWSAEAPQKAPAAVETAPSDAGLMTPASKAATAKAALPDVSTLEGATDDPNLTKVVDRRWYDRNKHIYPASMWQEFDPEKEYSSEVRKDTGGNTLFFSR